MDCMGSQNRIGRAFARATSARRRVVTAAHERPVLLTALALVIAVGTAVAMAIAAGPAKVQRVLEDPEPSWLGVLLAGQALAYLGYTLAHRGASRLRDGPDLPLDLAAKVVAVGFGPVALDGGFAVDRRALIGLGASSRDATVRVLALGSLEYAALAPAAMVAAIYLAVTSHVAPALTLPWAIGVPLGFGIGLWAAAADRRRRLCGSPHRVLRAIGRGLEGVALLRVLLAEPRRHWLAWVGIACYWAGDIISLWAGLQLFGIHPGAAALVLAYATGYALTPRSLPLAGVGVTEALMPVSLVWCGFAFAPAVVAVSAYRIIGLLLSAPLAKIGFSDVSRLAARGTSGAKRSRRQDVAPVDHVS